MQPTSRPGRAVGRPGPRAQHAARAGGLLLELSLALALALALVLLALRRMGGDNCMEHVADHEVAVITDALGRAPRVVAEPGYTFFVPWLETVHRLERRPVEHVMADEKDPGEADAPRLLVRGSDGTTLWLESVRIQVAIDPVRAALVLEDLGAGDAFRDGAVGAYARAILRDEFGRFRPEEIVEPEKRHQATVRSKERLGELFARHGLVVLDLAVSKPAFVPQYEATIERRKVAEQDLERMERDTQRTLAGRERRLELVQRELERDLARERASLVSELAAARAAATRKGAETDLYRAKRASEATLAVETQTALAAARLESYAKEAEGLRARAEAFAARGALAVRAALVDRLASMEFVIVPAPGRDEPASGVRQATHGGER